MVARVQNNGLAEITAALVNHNLAKFLQWGTGSAAAASANVVTTTSTTEARTTGTATQVTTTQTNDTYQVTGTITAAGARAITEVGVFDAIGSVTNQCMAIYEMGPWTTAVEQAMIEQQRHGRTQHGLCRRRNELHRAVALMARDHVAHVAREQTIAFLFHVQQRNAGARERLRAERKARRIECGRCDTERHAQAMQ